MNTMSTYQCFDLNDNVNGLSFHYCIAPVFSKKSVAISENVVEEVQTFDNLKKSHQISLHMNILETKTPVTRYWATIQVISKFVVLMWITIAL